MAGHDHASHVEHPPPFAVEGRQIGAPRIRFGSGVPPQVGERHDPVVGVDERRDVFARVAGRLEQPDAGGELDSLQLSKYLAKVIESESPDLVLTGKLAVDDENGQVPSMVAERLNWLAAKKRSRKTRCQRNTSATE